MHRILVVDDDPHIRDVICFALEKAGMATEIARNGSEALKLAELRNPDLVVLDVGMPELDGLEVCRRLRRNSEVPILFLSARSDEIDRILGLEMGGDDYVTKPFSRASWWPGSTSSCAGATAAPARRGRRGRSAMVRSRSIPRVTPPTSPGVSSA